MDNQIENAPVAPAPVMPTTGISRPRFVARRGNSTNFEPLVGTAKPEVEARLDREVCSGQVQEIDLYEYVGTARMKRSSEMVNIFEEPR